MDHAAAVPLYTHHAILRRRAAVVAIAMLVAAMLFVFARPASARVDNCYPPTSTACAPPGQPAEVLGETLTRPPEAPAAVSAAQSSRTSTLPFTGAEVAGAVVVALCLIGIGTAGVAVAHRRDEPAS